MDVANFAEIQDEFNRRVQAMIWCNVATVDRQQRPRSRLLHPLWEGTTGWICTQRDSFKSRHLEANPYVSLAYIQDIHRPVYVDCTAAWAADLDEKRRVWELFKNTPEPLGFAKSRAAGIRPRTS